jgi:tetratricopeptide (TPR) repeat protein
MSIPESLANLGSNLKKARDQFSDGKYEEAIDILNKIASFQEPLLQRSKLEEKNQIESVLFFAMTRSMIGQTYSKLEKEENSRKEMEESVRLFSSIWSKLEIKTADHYSDFGAALYKTDRKKNAFKILLEAEASKNVNADIYLLLGIMSLEDRENEDDALNNAEIYLNKSLKYNSLSPLTYRKLAQVFELRGKSEAAIIAKKEAESSTAELMKKAGRYGEALVAIDRALSFDQEDDNLMEAKAEILLELGNAQKAIDLLEHALKKDDKSIFRHLLLGSALSNLERNEAALDEYNKILNNNRDVGMIFVRVQKAVVLRSLNRIDEAMKELYDCLEISPYFPPAHIELGRTFLILNRLPQALEKAEEALKIEPANLDALALKGQILLMQGMIEEAGKFFGSLKDRLPYSVAIASMFFEALVSLGRPEEALTAIDEFLARSPDAKILRLKVELLMSQKRPTEALEAVDDLLQLSPNDPAALLLKGRIIRTLGDDPERSVELFERAVKIDPQCKKGFLMLSDLWLSLNSFDNALKAAEEALKLDPYITGALVNKGQALLRLNRYQDAIESFNQANDLEPNNIRMLTGRGECLRSLFRFEEALTNLRKAWKLAERDDLSNGGKISVNEKIMILHNKALSLLMLSRIDEASEIAEKGDKLSPHNSRILADLAAICRFKGKYHHAMDYVEKSLKYDLDKENDMAWVLKAFLQIDVTEYRNALKSIDEAISISNKHRGSLIGKDFLFTVKGWITLLLGPKNCLKAKKFFETAIDINPENPNPMALFGHAQTLRMLNDKNSAENEYKKIIESFKKLEKIKMNAGILSFLGLCHFYLKEYDEALRLLLEARSFSRSSSIVDSSALTISFQLALILMGSGRYERALEEYTSNLNFANESKRIDYIGSIDLALFNLNDVERENPALGEIEQFKKAKKLLQKYLKNNKDPQKDQRLR